MIYWFVAIGIILGLTSSIFGGILIYKNRLETHKTLIQQVILEERLLDEELSQIDKSELLKTKAGQELLKFNLEDLSRTVQLKNNPVESTTDLLELEKHNEVDVDELREVITSISKEFQQPKSSIIGYSDLLLGDSVGILGSLQRKFVERIKSSSEEIDNLISDLIQVINLDFGLIELKPEPLDLNEIINNAITQINNTQIENISLQQDFPRIDFSIYADREAMQKIMIQLIKNANAAMQPNKNTINLSIESYYERDREYVLLQIKDLSQKISPEEYEEIFSKLYDSKVTKVQGGTGLGLTWSKFIIEELKGNLWVDRNSESSIVNVLLPKAKK